MHTEIEQCRICGNPNLIPVLDLGTHYLSGVFPRVSDHLHSLTKGPLELVKCHDDDPSNAKVCHLLQLRQSYDLSEMYGDTYGYRSGLNPTMVNHLEKISRDIEKLVTFFADDYVIDIGSNDSTLLRGYSQQNIKLVGFDPSGEKFRKYYPHQITLIPESFSASRWRALVGDRKAKVITSIAMFYDLADPLRFMRDVYDVLANDGVWVLEQSYMPTMLEKVAYDTVCHEHLEYYGLAQIAWLADRVGFRMINLTLTKVNGGSFTVTLIKNGAYGVHNSFVPRERQRKLFTLEPYHVFAQRAERSREALLRFLDTTSSAGARIFGLGASTKGNTLLQYCGIGSDELACIGDVNTDKFGCFTPGTQIPIVSEQEVLTLKPDYLLVLPWHFRSFFENNSTFDDVALVFPLPTLTIRPPRKST